MRRQRRVPRHAFEVTSRTEDMLSLGSGFEHIRRRNPAGTHRL